MKNYSINFFCLLILFAVKSQAASKYISPSGNDNTGNGTYLNPYKSLNKACNNVLAGDTVFMLPGIYSITSAATFTPVGSVLQPIIIRPTTPGTVIFDAASASLSSTQAVLTMYQGQHAIFEGVEIRNSSGRGFSVFECENVVVKNCTIHDVAERAIGGSGHRIVIDGNTCYNACMANVNQGYGSSGWAIVISPTYFWSTGEISTNWQIRNNTIYNCWGEGIGVISVDTCEVSDNSISNVFSVSIYLEYFASNVKILRNNISFNDPAYRRDGNKNTDGIKWGMENHANNWNKQYAIENILIANNLIAGCRRPFSWYHESSGGSSDYYYSYRNVRILYNTTYDATDYSMYLYAMANNANPPQNCVFANNICDTIIELQNHNSAWSFYNNLWKCGIPSQGQHLNSLSSLPFFANPVIGGPASGFQLTSASPCVSAAAPIADVTTDFWNIPRSIVSPCIGFHEFITTTDVGVDVESNIIIFPNPAGEILMISGHKNEVERFDVFDMSGRFITSVNGDVNSIDLSNFNPLYALENLNGGLRTSRFEKKCSKKCRRLPSADNFKTFLRPFFTR